MSRHYSRQQEHLLTPQLACLINLQPVTRVRDTLSLLRKLECTVRVRTAHLLQNSDTKRGRILDFAQGLQIALFFNFVSLEC
jgi:hypothetical protein